MEPARSDEAAQGSAGTGSNQPPVEFTRYSSNRVARLTHDRAAPVSATLALLSFSQPSVPPRRDHTELLDSIDNLFGERRHGDRSGAAASATTGSGSSHGGPCDGQPSIEETLRGIGGRFGGAQSSSAGSSATAGRQ